MQKSWKFDIFRKIYFFGLIRDVSVQEVGICGAAKLLWLVSVLLKEFQNEVNQRIYHLVFCSTDSAT